MYKYDFYLQASIVNVGEFTFFPLFIGLLPELYDAKNNFFHPFYFATLLVIKRKDLS